MVNMVRGLPDGPPSARHGTPPAAGCQTDAATPLSKVPQRAPLGSSGARDQADPIGTLGQRSGGHVMIIETKLKQMGIALPDFGGASYYGANYGKMKPFHRTGSLLILSGHVPDLPDGTPLHPGRVGAEVTVEQAYRSARQTGINCLAG